VRDGRYVVVIVDDHALFSQGLALLLESRAGEKFVVAGSTTAGEEAVALVGREGADIAIVDLALPPLGGVETIRRITATGFLGKSADPEVLVAPLLTIAAGVRVVRADLLDALLAAGDRAGDGLVERLDGRELQLWVLLARGLETSEIARPMLVSERTAKRMIASLLHKLGAANRIEAAALAGRYGLLDDERDP
jgi:DNA-binding NarL/FixJ family response regulator